MHSYTTRKRFQAVMQNGDASKGLPIIEWAGWWNLTRENWIRQGAPENVALSKWYGLDEHYQIWYTPSRNDIKITNEADYDRIRPDLYPVPQFDSEVMEHHRRRQEEGEEFLWLTLEGPFWFPRTLFGIQQHFYAFYDHPNLMKRINEDLAEFSIKVIEAICEYYIPDFMTFAEDMSYNHGPMISYKMMDEFMEPFYLRVVPELMKRGIIPMIDSDGDVEPLIPWFENVGLQGILPLERIAFNALPATFKPDMWAHQYDQQANQVICKVSEDRIYTNNGPEANIFGLEPNYGCCTSNMHQGWPKFASHLWMKSADGGLLVIAYAPCTVNTRIADIPVKIELQTDYPFDDTLSFTVEVDKPVEFPLRIRIPAWSEGANVKIGNENPVPAAAGTTHCIKRKWVGIKSVTLRLPMHVRIRRRYHNAVSIERGPLVYALKIDEEWSQIRGELPHADWEVYPKSPWNYAIQIDEEHPEKSIDFLSHPAGDCPFSPDGAPVRARVKGRRIPEWTIEHNAAVPPPESPVSSSQPLEDLILIPYGCTNLRVTEFPTLV